MFRGTSVAARRVIRRHPPRTGTCSFDVTQTFPEGTFRLFGTATGFFTPAS